MKWRERDSKIKPQIVLEGLQGRFVASICNEYESRAAKEELFWLHEGSGPDYLKTSLDQWAEDYKNNYRHSSLGCQTSDEVHSKHQPGGKNFPLIVD